MVAALVDESAPSIRPLKRSEYDRLVSAGAFQGERLELIKGVIVRMSPQDARHAWAIQRLTELLFERVGRRAAVRVQLPLAVSEDSEPEPDIAVCERRDYQTAHPSSALLVVEVALTSLRFDRSTKAELYARAGVAEYWIVDLAGERIEVHTAPSGTAYSRVTTYDKGASITLTAINGITVAVADLL
jgi:Uma2 family endonuclease